MRLVTGLMFGLVFFKVQSNLEPNKKKLQTVKESKITLRKSRSLSQKPLFLKGKKDIQPSYFHVCLNSTKHTNHPDTD